MIREVHGNLLRAEAEALVNTVNTVGVMGKGIALQFQRAFPANYKAYKAACARGEVRLGHIFVWDQGALAGDGPRYIVNFPTKQHWRSKSRLSDIEAGLEDLVRVVGRLGIASIAVPPLGCGHGGLRWDQVRRRIMEAFAALPDVVVLVYPPEGAPRPGDQPVGTDRPRMTPGRAALVALMGSFLPFAVEVTTVDIQKLMYFLQEAGEGLRLQYAKGLYGPYADNLRHVLQTMEGHFIRGTGDGTAGALDAIPFELLDGAIVEAKEVLSARSETAARIDQVSQLIAGFESTYGLELLATVHWVATRDANGRHRDQPLSDEQVESAVRSWNLRKGKLFSPAHVRTALTHLRSHGWLGGMAPQGLLA